MLNACGENLSLVRKLIKRLRGLKDVFEKCFQFPAGFYISYQNLLYKIWSKAKTSNSWPFWPLKVKFWNILC